MKLHEFHSIRSVSAAKTGTAAQAAFTLVEIALCLGIIGFALVAIIGVLPEGVKVQKENREETTINQDGLYFLEAIRSGARGMDDLMNYVDYIAISNMLGSQRRIEVFTNRILRARAGEFAGAKPLTNGQHIVSLLTRPKVSVLANGQVWSNTVSAFTSSISGVAADKSVNNLQVREFAFRYLLRSEVIPFVSNTNYLQSPLAPWDERVRQYDLTNNLYDLRLTLSWPVFQRSGGVEIGPNRKVFRALISGALQPTAPGEVVFNPQSYSSRN